MPTVDRSISAAGLARLLARLDPDPDRAAAGYERLRRILIRFFDWRGAWPPEDCADTALDRLARKLEEDTQVADVAGYAHGIARLVLLEWRRQPRSSPIDDAAFIAEPRESSQADGPERACFDRCLAEMSTDTRSIVLQYYQGERHEKISNRRRLAASLGTSDTALRSRVQRIRNSLERCVDSCVSGMP